MKKKPAIKSFRLKNFKAIRDSGTVKFGPLTVFIGNNGAGKSSLIEGLETFRNIVSEGLDAAMDEWLAFEDVWNKRAQQRFYGHGTENFRARGVMSFELRKQGLNGDRILMEIYKLPTSDAFWIGSESVRYQSHPILKDSLTVNRDERGALMAEGVPQNFLELGLAPGQSSVMPPLKQEIQDWQFLSLHPEEMGLPTRFNVTTGSAHLDRDAANLGRYLHEIYDDYPYVLQGIVETMQYVLPYVSDIRTNLTTQLGRMVSIEMKEGDIDIPGWMLSTGTLRVLAILAVLRHPDPPPLLVIEELENGLDPRTMRVVMDEIRTASAAGRTQVVATTHSPYCLGLCALDEVVLVDRENDNVRFFRPEDDELLREWSSKYSVGELYTSGSLRRRLVK